MKLVVPFVIAVIVFVMAVIVVGCGGSDGPTFGPDMTIGEDMTMGQPCVDTSQCPGPTFVCAYKIADGCAAKGHCAPVATPTCAYVIEMCGCDGKPVLAGPCFYASGYAGGATTGAIVPACGDGGT